MSSGNLGGYRELPRCRGMDGMREKTYTGTSGRAELYKLGHKWTRLGRDPSRTSINPSHFPLLRNVG